MTCAVRAGGAVSVCGLSWYTSWQWYTSCAQVLAQPMSPSMDLKRMLISEASTMKPSSTFQAFLQ